ncbi:DUF1223 domain-containing protein [Rhodobacteraceae bacterium 63075]|nr:DUF1223 domain-containing protein [Rhodobacteraceae bacterium 63075]
MILAFAAAFGLAGVATGLKAEPDRRLVVVELFTSQGCSSCPPADKFLHDLAKRDDVLALGLHVDYWDYIGWKDVFASPAFSERQRSYARAGNRRSVYTPQMIVQGQQHVVGNHPLDVNELIARHQSQAPQVLLDVQSGGESAQVIARAADAPGVAKREMSIVLLRYKPKETVKIRRGENAGKQLSYANIVTEMDVLRGWDMRAPLKLRVDIEGSERAALIVQAQGHGPIMAAARLK